MESAIGGIPFFYLFFVYSNANKEGFMREDYFNVPLFGLMYSSGEYFIEYDYGDEDEYWMNLGKQNTFNTSYYGL